MNWIKRRLEHQESLFEPGFGKLKNNRIQKLEKECWCDAMSKKDQSKKSIL